MIVKIRPRLSGIALL